MHGWGAQDPSVAAFLLLDDPHLTCTTPHPRPGSCPGRRLGRSRRDTLKGLASFVVTRMRLMKRHHQNGLFGSCSDLVADTLQASATPVLLRHDLEIPRRLNSPSQLSMSFSSSSIFRVAARVGDQVSASSGAICS